MHGQAAEACPCCFSAKDLELSHKVCIFAADNYLGYGTKNTIERSTTWHIKTSQQDENC